ncbi:hypothetical protein Goklo_026918 [Gossypium klotzschianum]|uniref:Uncharacterized protein n=1 Tax=Gossypium klotzschianum TaxID=34286 RepID=A0A7J8TWP8_9ROSI|nr:hypothetical protein [Gossypium klotzschianum]
MKAVANQPVSIVIDAGGKDFQFYSEKGYINETSMLKKAFEVQLWKPLTLSSCIPTTLGKLPKGPRMNSEFSTSFC